MSLLSVFLSKFLYPLPVINFSREAVGDHIKSLGENQVDNDLCSHHINQAGYFATEGNQICREKFTLDESMLAFLKPMLHFTCEALRWINSITFPGTKV